MLRTDANDESQETSEQVMLPKADDSWHNSLEQCQQALHKEDDLEKMDSIHNILVLLSASFPKNDGANHFYSQWSRCAALHNPIQTLRDKVVALKHIEPMDNDDKELYTELILNDIWCVLFGKETVCIISNLVPGI